MAGSGSVRNYGEREFIAQKTVAAKLEDIKHRTEALGFKPSNEITLGDLSSFYAQEQSIYGLSSSNNAPLTARGAAQFVFARARTALALALIASTAAEQQQQQDAWDTLNRHHGGNHFIQFTEALKELRQASVLKSAGTHKLYKALTTYMECVETALTAQLCPYAKSVLMFHLHVSNDLTGNLQEQVTTFISNLVAQITAFMNLKPITNPLTKRVGV